MNKEYKKGKFTLNHNRYLDAMGFEKDSFDLIWIESDGVMHHRPFLGDLKVNVSDRNSPIGKIGFNYTDEDYEKMIDEQVLKV